MTSAEYIDLTSLAQGVQIDVETKNRHYLIECLGGGDILISGHPEYCPTPVAGHFQGSSDRGGVLESGLIGAESTFVFCWMTSARSPHRGC